MPHLSASAHGRSSWIGSCHGCSRANLKNISIILSKSTNPLGPRRNYLEEVEIEAAAHSSDSHQLPAAARPREENAAHTAQCIGPATDREGSSPCGPTSSRALPKEFSLTGGAGGAEEHRRAVSPPHKVPQETNCSRTHCCYSLGQMAQCYLLNPPVRKQKHHPSKDRCQVTASVLNCHFPTAGGTSLHRYICHPQCKLSLRSPLSALYQHLTR